MFYTSVVKLGNAIGHRYVKDGVRHQDIVRNFEYSLFLKNPHSTDSVSVRGDPLKEYKFDDIFSMQEFVKEHGSNNVYGNSDPVSQFIHKTYPDEIKLTNDYVVLNFDIETEHAGGIPEFHYTHIVKLRVKNGDTFDHLEVKLEDVKSITGTVEIHDERKNNWCQFEDSCYAPKSLGFPDPNLAVCEILSIAMVTNHSNKICVIGTKDYNGVSEISGEGFDIEYIYAVNEKELLVKFIQKWREIKPDILTGWNIDGFDVPYIINRIVRILGKKFANMLSPFSNESQNCIKERQIEDSVVYSIAGITMFDYMGIYKKFARSKQESYRLDWIGEVEVDHKKISYEEYDNSLMKLWEYNYDKFVLYNSIDTLIVHKLDNKLKFIGLAITIAHATKSDLSDALGTIKIWDNLIFNLLQKKNVQIDPHVQKEKNKEFMGAFVKEPLFGRHGWLLTYDLTSLYPSVIRGFGMSPETLVHREVGNDLSANSEEIRTLNYNIKEIDSIIGDK